MKDHFPRALWSVWDNCVWENILVFIMFEPTLPAKTSISSPRAGFCGIVSLDFISKYPCFLTNTEKKVSSGIVVCRFSTCVRMFSSFPDASRALHKEREGTNSISQIAANMLCGTACRCVCGCVLCTLCIIIPPVSSPHSVSYDHHSHSHCSPRGIKEKSKNEMRTYVMKQTTPTHNYCRRVACPCCVGHSL